MKNLSLNLYLEINNQNFAFYVEESDEQKTSKIIYETKIPLQGIDNNRIFDQEKTYSTIKEKIYFIEQKYKFTFKEIILILDYFNLSFTNITGFKKLNGSQILRENVTYILNTLKSYVSETETTKTVLHIFNSRFELDNKKIENLPIGLFGDFYSHELSFVLMNTNDYKNLTTIFEKCNLRIKKIFIKSFITGANISSEFRNNETFFVVKINENNSKILFFENNSLKFEQSFNFGTNILIKDISKVTALNLETVKIILDKIKLSPDISEDETIDKIFFKNENYRKIKKKLIYEVVLARVKEMHEIILYKNVNFKHYIKAPKVVFLEIDNKTHLNNFDKIFEKFFSLEFYSKTNFVNITNNILINTANKLVHFGWNKEAIPVTQSKKSLINRFFDAVFG